MSLFIAIDHRNESISKHLNSPASEEVACRLRREIASISMDCLPDGLIVSLNDHHWAVSEFQEYQTILGLPDVTSWPGFASAISLQYASLPVKPNKVKIGFSLDDTQSRVADTLVNLEQAIINIDPYTKWIVEPYFSVSLSLPARQKFIETASLIPNVWAFKLDVYDPIQNARAYTEASASKPWFSRSDGMTFAEYHGRLEIAMQNGCSGSIVGAAVWGESVSGLLLPQTTNLARTQITIKIANLKALLLKYKD